MTPQNGQGIPVRARSGQGTPTLAGRWASTAPPASSTAPARRELDRSTRYRVARFTLRPTRASRRRGEAEPLGRNPEHDGAHDLVGQGLALAVPQREEPPDVADEVVHDMGETADDAQRAPDRLARASADALDSYHSHAGRLSRLAHLHRQIDRQRNDDQIGEHEDDVHCQSDNVERHGHHELDGDVDKKALGAGSPIREGPVGGTRSRPPWGYAPNGGWVPGGGGMAAPGCVGGGYGVVGGGG